MTSRLSFILVFLVALSIGADAAFNDLHGSLFLSRKFLDFVDWVIFWH